MPSLRDIIAEEQSQAKAAAATEAQVKATADAEAKVATVAAEAVIATRLARGETPCWLCKRDKKVVAFHKCKENICPIATTAYTRFDRWGNPNTAYPAHPLRAYYSASGVPSHSNNFYRRAFQEYDREQAYIATKEAAKVRAAEEATGLTGDEAVKELKKLTRPPKHGLAEFFNQLDK